MNKMLNNVLLCSVRWTWHRHLENPLLFYWTVSQEVLVK